MPLTQNYQFTRNTRIETSQGSERGGTPFATREEIARLAYAYWEERGRPLGSAEEDWFRAERELRARSGASKLPGKTPRRLRLALIELQTEFGTRGPIAANAGTH